MTSGPPSGIKVRVYVTKDLGNVVTDEENKILYRDVRILYRNSNGVLQVPEEKLKAVSGMQNFVPVFNGGGPKRLYECGNFVWFKIINGREVMRLNRRGTKVQRSYHLPKEIYDAAVQKLEVQEQRYEQRIREISALYAPKIQRIQKEKNREEARLRTPRLRLEVLVK